MAARTKIELDTTVSATADQVSSTLEDEEVILHLASGTYYGLNAVGQRVWTLIQSPQSVRTVCDRLHAEFEVSREQLETDVLALLREMQDEDLVRVHGT